MAWYRYSCWNMVRNTVPSFSLAWSSNLCFHCPSRFVQCAVSQLHCHGSLGQLDIHASIHAWSHANARFWYCWAFVDYVRSCGIQIWQCSLFPVFRIWQKEQRHKPSNRRKICAWRLRKAIRLGGFINASPQSGCLKANFTNLLSHLCRISLRYN